MNTLRPLFFILCLFLVGCPLEGGEGGGGGDINGGGSFGTGTPPGGTGEDIESLNTNPLSGICQDLAGTFYLSSEDGRPLVSSDGSNFSVLEGTDLNLNDVHCDQNSTTNPLVVFVGDGGSILAYDGSALSSQESGTTGDLRGVFGFDRSRVWAVGDAGTIRFFNGTDWSTAQKSNTTETLHDVSGRLNPAGVFAVGEAGNLRELQGSSWIQVDEAELPGTFNLSTDLYGIWAEAPTGEIFVVGEGGTILRRQAGVWELQTSGTSKDLFAVHGSSSSNVIAVGEDGTILIFDGTAWSEVDLESTPTFLDVLVLSTSSALLVGRNITEEDTDGVIFQGSASGFTQIF